PNNESKLKVPDELFFGSEKQVDLSDDYGDNKRRKETVRGIIHTLNKYKFTVEENTPIEEEIALDPELLGKVFENLLASYNPETHTTARKQTGSFYTPREIVNFMVDESLIAYLENSLTDFYVQQKYELDENRKAELSDKIRQLVSYNDLPHSFNEQEVNALIKAIDRIKILDPACGSGAFPMGILHKLVFILNRLDPHNERWKNEQVAKVEKMIETASEIADHDRRQQIITDLEKQIASIEDAFANNELDYGRKLYLIENCIYGVDIQPIAVQIAKLRFFISLVIDQRVVPANKNMNIRPLPNLETKFVAANTLIGLEKPAQMSLRNPEIEQLEKQLKTVRQRHFRARTRSEKQRYRTKDEQLRRQIAELLIGDGWNDKVAHQIADWDPYDQNSSSDFFDPEWMFGIENGFDVVIGNPPYVVDKNLSELEKKLFINNYKSALYQINLYLLFIEKALYVSRKNGTISELLTSRKQELQHFVD
ncbi:MAG: Eco57I restriction-modification methylase domain-containing protein, partial [bacterium]|nr:Eco57I restriction-modification methylase domain-containing protein [bacterium]